MPTQSTAQSMTAARLTTGIAGLDDILAGGLHRERVYLVEGTPGTGKTTLALQFLLAGAALGEGGLYVTLSESKPELEASSGAHGWSLDGIDVFELINDEELDPGAEQTILYPSELELGETTRGVLDRVRQTRPARVVFDSMSELRLLAQDPLRYRRQVLALKQFFTQQKCTVLLLDDRTSDSADVQLHSIVYGVITLEQIALDYGAERRRVRVVKLRGTRYRGGYHDFTIGTGGLNVFPRLVAAEHHKDFITTPVSAGLTALDDMLGGGFVPGTNALLIGPSGVGKTTLAVCALAASLRRGERGALFLFDEGMATLLRRAHNLDLDLSPYIETGQLTIMQVNPAELSPGDFASRVRQTVQGGSKTIVIDSLNAYMHAMPGETFLLLHMHELLTYLNQRGVVTLMIMAQHGVGGPGLAAVDISYLADTIVLLRFFEREGEVRKAVLILKTRTAAHELSARELILGGAGLSIGAPLTSLHPMLSSDPAWTDPATLAKLAVA